MRWLGVALVWIGLPASWALAAVGGAAHGAGDAVWLPYTVAAISAAACALGGYALALVPLLTTKP